MEEVLFNALQGQGIWTVCAVLLTVYVLRTSGIREEKLQEIISKQADGLVEIKDIKEDVKEIKNKIK